ncbi:MAG: hypothetical protein IJV36_00615 [Prevotella sp.]|nr:hypothetical protein [Prevotella sp.]
MKHFALYLLLLCPTGLQAQTKTDQLVDSIMNYLAMNSLDGYAVVESNGRNHAVRGEFTINNAPIMATSKLVHGLRPWLDQLPHLRKMTDERTGEVLDGRIAMRLQPEEDDTSAYFLMTYNRTKLTFKYGVNSPGSISLAKSSAHGPGVGFDHKELSAEEAAPIVSLFDEYSRRSDARVVDTLFRNEGDMDYEWCTGEHCQTKARVVLLPAPTESEIQQWANLFFLRYNLHDEVTISLRNSFRQMKNYLVSVNCAFTMGGAFHLYLAGRYSGHFCLIHVVAQPGELCVVVPGFVRLIDHLIGTAQHEQHIAGHPAELIALMEKEMQQRKRQAGAQVTDTLFVSNDHEGHLWWTGMDSRCPTRAHLVRTPSSETDFDALHQRIRSALDTLVTYNAWTDDDDEQCIFLSWTDEQQHLHAYVVYYIIATHQLVIERADGEEPGNICIPHYCQEWFRFSP